MNRHDIYKNYFMGGTKDTNGVNKMSVQYVGEETENGIV